MTNRTVASSDLREEVNNLAGKGVGTEAIAKELGISISMVHTLKTAIIPSGRTERRDLIRELAKKGLQSKEIAEMLGISKGTVRVYWNMGDNMKWRVEQQKKRKRKES